MREFFTMVFLPMAFCIVVFILPVCAFAVWTDYAGCTNQSIIMSRAYKWDIWAGCYIQANGGQYLPAKAFVQADINVHSVK